MKRILLVEDEPVLREVFAEGLAREGYDVQSAKDGAEARWIFSRLSPVDLLIADIKLPDESGIQLVEDFKKNTPGISVIVITAYELFQSDYELWSAGINAYMVKPVDLDELRAHVKKIIPL